MNSHRLFMAFANLLIGSSIFCIPAIAQPVQPEQKAPRVAQCASTADNVHVFYLRNVTQQMEANELYTALRQLLPPEVKSFFVPNQLAIEICAQPDQIALAQKIVNDLDRAKSNYRVTYTVVEIQGAKRLGAHQYSLIVTPGQESTLKQGSRVPIVTGRLDAAQNQQTQMSYVDIGMNFQATIDATAAGIRLRTAVEQSSVVEEKSGVASQDPVIRQTTFKGTSYLVAGKTLKLGTLDLPDTDRHLELEVAMEPVP